MEEVVAYFKIIPRHLCGAKTAIPASSPVTYSNPGTPIYEVVLQPFGHEINCWEFILLSRDVMNTLPCFLLCSL